MSFEVGSWYKARQGHGTAVYLCVYANDTHAALEVYRLEHAGKPGGISSASHSQVMNWPHVYEKIDMPTWIIKEYVPSQDGDRSDDI